MADESFDCVVSRLELPDADGLSFLSSIADVPVDVLAVLYTPRYDSDLVARTYGVGVEYVHDADGESVDVLDRFLANLPSVRTESAPERSERPSEEGATATDRIDWSVDDNAWNDAAPREPNRHLATLAATTPDAILTIDTDSVVQFANPAIEEVLGYAPEDIVGRPLTTVMSDDLAERHRRGFQRYLDTDERHLDWDGVELPGQHADGHEVSLSVSFSEYVDDGERLFTGVLRDVTERKRREQQLTRLNELAQALATAETTQVVCDLAVEAANEVLDLPVACIELYDETTGRLTPVAETSGVDHLVGDDALFASEYDVLWEVYATQEEKILDDVLAEADLPEEETSLRSAIVLPVGTDGVFVSGATERDAFTEAETVLAQILVANVEAALDRVERERTLRERTAELETQAETLARVNRINSVIREITRSLTQASTREEIEQTICTQLANAEPYRFAWIGEQATVGGEIVPKTSAGVERGYLDEITVTSDESPTGQGPAGRAARTHEPQVQNNLDADPPFEPWRTEALRRGYRASIAVPLVYKDTLYGVLNLYAGQSDVFDDVEIAVLRELGEMIGYAVKAVERKKALVTDSAVELRFRITDTNVTALRFAGQTGGRFEFEALVEQADGSLRAFFTVSGASFEETEQFVRDTSVVRDLNLIADRDGDFFFEATISESSLLTSVMEYGAHPTELIATPEGGELTVELPQNGDVKAFLEMFLDTYEGAELLARRELDRPIQTEEEFKAVYEKRLTERETEVLRTAYFAGFFEWPRESSGSDVADILGVSQPTVNRHVRSGERKLFELVFEGD
ncbi:response regulator receiver protein [halophilic archaeon]|nr:response regulator receiver protein [halophilic archaeon]